MKRKILAILLSVTAAVTMLTGCGTSSKKEVKNTEVTASKSTEGKTPKYVFLFIGDGMSSVQINATQVYRGNNTSGQIATKPLNFTGFPAVGLATTFDATSFCPDSASTGTSISSGVKTHSGVIGLNVDKTTKPESITEKLKAAGKKIGIVSTVTINHATPAAFYAHVPSRNDYYDIAMQLPESNFDYFGGGSIYKATGDKKDKQDAYEVIKSKGYTIANKKEDIQKLDSSSNKVYAVTPVTEDSGSMPYTIDTKDGDLTLADYVSKGIDILDNDKGFFLMCESGKIDWACHANDAMSAIKEVIGLESAVQKAIDFAGKHPDETLILVTGDHETGGMTIGYAATGYNTAFNILDKQKISYIAFDTLISKKKEANPNISFEEVMPMIKENFGLIAPGDADANVEANKPYVLTSYEYQKLQNAFAESMKKADQRTKNEETAVLYGEYDPLSVTITHIINNKAGIGWTSYSHTGTPVPVYAYGASSEIFEGSYDNTDIFKKLVDVCKVK
ncbi:alkaline phosphatase [Clostridium cellulovorans]|uniref:Alkaline phosphatase n=1 Tax=Clostridium cellulovorans (strain ATCC 35296 / DSM 3052 / OCM 3 / 743B) TaxID=573061 RepID=D9SQL5_CLOC7|nr:alkaline phosphatase [Clostridium cellulovorans]ADL52221.1 Alkaline phosphatase [Clostridium cellulovorans 743B]